MEIYFSPLACSMTSRIALYEAKADARFVEVDTAAKRTKDEDADYLAINPLGLVPALRTDDGAVITENAAILQYLAEHFPDAALAPRGGIERTRLQQWLSFIGTELHKAVFNPLLDRKAPEGAKEFAIGKSQLRLDIVARHLEGRDFLLDRFSVADAYLVTVLGWTAVVPIDLARWPVLASYVARLRTRPSVARAIAEEGALYARRRG
jgi:glutathione S-transferase